MANKTLAELVAEAATFGITVPTWEQFQAAMKSIGLSATEKQYQNTIAAQVRAAKDAAEQRDYSEELAALLVSAAGSTISAALSAATHEIREAIAEIGNLLAGIDSAKIIVNVDSSRDISLTYAGRQKREDKQRPTWQAIGELLLTHKVSKLYFRTHRDAEADSSINIKRAAKADGGAILAYHPVAQVWKDIGYLPTIVKETVAAATGKSVKSVAVNCYEYVHVDAARKIDLDSWLAKLDERDEEGDGE